MLILYRIYQFTIYWPILLVATILTASLTIIGSALGWGRSWGYYIPRLWAKLFCWLTFVKVTVKGRENVEKGKSYVFVANHQGAYDIFAIYGYLNHQFRWMMKKSLEKIPLVGYSCRVSGQIYVDNSSPSAIRETMEDAKKQLAGGMSVVVFPEGSRTFTGAVGRFKRGAYTLAMEFNLPVVPITIDGAFKVMPRTAKLPHWGHITLTIHKPIEPGEEGHDLNRLMDDSRNAILSSLK
ncbi:MAG: 1-acyl-sn-glycerol-3-phosphate acyltransferase [Bacteroidales bacterium]|nr:1-acyl-sn-glycerol-3-phosphate acyltransferase [Bacteroidales bacterium]